MKREKISSKNENFIGCWKIESLNLFDKIIDFFEKNPQLQSKGTVAEGINHKIKKTTDITIDPLDLKKMNTKYLMIILMNYISVIKITENNLFYLKLLKL